MDPLSIAASVAALATLCGQIGTLCNDIAGKRESFRRTLISLHTESVVYQAALHNIYDLLLDQSGPLASYLGSNEDWAQSFDTALTACGVTFSILASELKKALDTAGSSTMRYILKEHDIKELVGELRGQPAAIQMLIQSLQ